MLDTNRITSDSVLDLIFNLKWKSYSAVHTDSYQASRVNTWRDLLPQVLLETLMNKEAGERVQVLLEAGEAVKAFTKQNLFDIHCTQFDRQAIKDMVYGGYHMGPLGSIRRPPMA